MEPGTKVRYAVTPAADQGESNGLRAPDASRCVAPQSPRFVDHDDAAGHGPALGLHDGCRRRCERRRSEEHTSELQSLMRISYAVFCLKKKNTRQRIKNN